MPDTKATVATLPVGFVYKNTLNPLNIELKKPRMARDEVNDHDVRQGTCALPTSRTGANPFGRNRPLTCVKWIIYAITRLIVFWCIIGTVLLVCFVSSNMPLFLSRTATLETKSFDEPVPLFQGIFLIASMCSAASLTLQLSHQDHRPGTTVSKCIVSIFVLCIILFAAAPQFTYMKEGEVSLKRKPYSSGNCTNLQNFRSAFEQTCPLN